MTLRLDEYTDPTTRAYVNRKRSKERMLADALGAVGGGIDRSPGRMVGPAFIPNYAGVVGGISDIGQNVASIFAAQKESEQADADEANLQNWLKTAPTDGGIDEATGLTRPVSKEQKMAHMLQAVNIPELRGQALKSYMEDSNTVGRKTPFVTNLTSGWQADNDTGEVRALPEVQAYNARLFGDRQSAKDQYRQQGWEHGEDAYTSRLQKANEAYEARQGIKAGYVRPETIELEKSRNEKIQSDLAVRRELQKTGKPMTDKQIAVGNGLVDMLAELTDLEATFKDEYSGGPQKIVERKLGSGPLATFAPKSTQEMAAWNRNNEKMAVLPERYKAFGATLSEHEAEAWRAASINETTPPDKVRENFEVRRNILLDKVNATRGELQANAYNSAGLEKYAEQRGLGDQLADLDKPGGPLTEIDLNNLRLTESGGRGDAVSKTGARGYYQIQPETAAKPGYGLKPINLDTATEQQQRNFARRYIKAMMRVEGWSKAQAISAYNMGPKNVSDAGGAIVNPSYVGKVLPQTAVTSDEALLSQYGVR